jgi:pyruvate-formate lyase
MVVKVSGISFRYIDLPKHIQDDIIARTEFGVA